MLCPYAWFADMLLNQKKRVPRGKRAKYREKRNEDLRGFSAWLLSTLLRSCKPQPPLDLSPRYAAQKSTLNSPDFLGQHHCGEPIQLCPSIQPRLPKHVLRQQDSQHLRGRSLMMMTRLVVGVAKGKKAGIRRKKQQQMKLAAPTLPFTKTLERNFALGLR